jgi:peptidoglycan/xylan/chitin deacetylase (PgdA/CDA1 family)
MHSDSVAGLAKSAVKSFAEHSLSFVIRASGQQWRAGRRAILSYHNIVPDERPRRGDDSLHLPLSQFRSHLEMLAEVAEVVPLDDLLASPHPGGRPLVSITFDDAYVGAVRLGLAELRKSGFACTVFCAVGLLDGHAFWWDRWLDSRSGASASFRTFALESLKGFTPLVDAYAEEQGFTPWEADEWCRSASDDELREAVAGGSAVVGSHTLLHRNLGAVFDRAVLEDDLVEAKRWVDSFGVGGTSALCLPYGLVSDGNLALVRELGYRNVLRVNGGPIPNGTTGFELLPRIGVPSRLTADGLRLRLAGFFSA